MNFENKNFLVYGLGKAGRSAVAYLLKKGANVYAYDDVLQSNYFGAKEITCFEDVAKLNLEICLLSPGVCILGNKNIEFLNANNIVYQSEFGFAAALLKGKKIAVTGTNGKTTTVNLIYEMMKQKYENVFLCGNTNCSVFDVVEQTTDDCVCVLEVSSFALESIGRFECDVSCVLNITEDHISRHKTFANYVECKNKIYKNQTYAQYFVCDINYTHNAMCITHNYAINQHTNYAYYMFDEIYYGSKKIVSKKKIALLGEKNLENILCSVCVAKIMGVANKSIAKVLKYFKTKKHRMNVFVRNKVTYINDSKSTNVDSTINALSANFLNVCLLLGGQEKGFNFDKIFEYGKFKKIVCFGAAANKIEQCAKKYNFCNIYKFDTMQEGVLFAKRTAQKKDTILLSPACASFDEFANYKERGEFFVKLTKRCK